MCVQREIGDELAKMLLAGDVSDGSTVTVETSSECVEGDDLATGLKLVAHSEK